MEISRGLQSTAHTRPSLAKAKNRLRDFGREPDPEGAGLGRPAEQLIRGSAGQGRGRSLLRWSGGEDVPRRPATSLPSRATELIPGAGGGARAGEDERPNLSPLQGGGQADRQTPGGTQSLAPPPARPLKQGKAGREGQ